MPATASRAKAKWASYIDTIASVLPNVAAARDDIVREYDDALDRLKEAQDIVSSVLTANGLSSYLYNPPMFRYVMRLVRRAQSQNGDLGTFATGQRDALATEMALEPLALAAWNTACDQAAALVAGLFVTSS